MSNPRHEGTAQWQWRGSTRGAAKPLVNIELNKNSSRPGKALETGNENHRWRAKHLSFRSSPALFWDHDEIHPLLA